MKLRYPTYRTIVGKDAYVCSLMYNFQTGAGSMNDYVRMERLPNGNLRMHLTEAGITGAWALGQTEGGNDILKMRWLLLGTDYHIIRPEQIGALTDAPIIGDNAEEYVWWYPDYAIRDCVAVALRDGYVDFELAPEE